MTRILSRWGWAVIALISLLAAGCGGSDGRVPVNKTSGKLVWPEHKVLGLMVVLHPTDPAAPKLPAQLTGAVHADGNFTITCYDVSDGAPAGEYVVTIREAPMPDGTPRPKLPAAKYLDPKSSPLRVTTEKKPQNELPPLTISE
ncbi:Uncharacterized protein OS=Pirellula staleyi (strain ATCC 27377 / DSM 6068 / ICPB 4128) GN=Psta_0604 PE=4 SV=1 [Gemmata massiliana]|uniref:Carboxypeptidase regulatory-like domain-containing protein n=1 Tax=Gemmata massiliana TaxID=1210884 RepID=A0A6P2DG00_9BACT|nr:hypothetical protein [Gemmata massiliana]VTR98497.1 Uncharacterized protein OS=Pirellula staleyi (strain ATCC 27377 / DSM 6068 / ICPB 4128) GN=Psta_0604 PE=4 SV=1 [Gemmata massiliana]